MKKRIVFAVALFLCLGVSALHAQPPAAPQQEGLSAVTDSCPQTPDLFAPAASLMTACSNCRPQRMLCDAWCTNNNWSPPCYEDCQEQYNECLATCT